MKYEIRYYLNGDKTRFYDTEITCDDSGHLVTTLQAFIFKNDKATIQKIVKL